MVSTAGARWRSTGSPYRRMEYLDMQAIVPGPSRGRRCLATPVAHARTGSTSTRSRPGGRGTDARRSHNVSWSGARTDHAPSTGPLTSTPSGAASRRARAVGLGRGPDTSAKALKGGSASARRTSASAAASTPGSADTAASDGRVTGLARLDDHPPRGPVAGAPPGADAATSRAARAKSAKCLLGGAEPRSQELGVEVQERHRVGLGHPVQRGLGAHHHPGAAEVVLLCLSEPAGPHTSATATPERASRSSRRRVTPSRSAFMRVAPHRAHTTGRSSPQRRQRSVGAGPGDSVAGREP